MTEKQNRRFERQFSRLQDRMPKTLRGWILWLRQPYARLVRLPLGFLLVLGGMFSFLPVLGIWMLPLGLLLLAVDLPILQGPMAGWLIRIGRWWEKRRHKK